ncbi:MAG: OB-fold domain-containing protein [Bradyrhizobium sp.]
MLPQPEITPLNKSWWDALSGGQLLYQCCSACGARWLPARTLCPTCLKQELEWKAAEGHAKLLSWVVYHVAYNEAFKDRLPYNVALVELTEGPRLISSVLAPLNELRGDAPLVLKIETEDGIALPRFQLERSPQ